MAGGGPFTPFSLELGSDAEMKAVLRRLGPLGPQEAARAMLPELKAILFGAKTRVPVRTGRLSASGRIWVPRVYPDAVVGKVTFGEKGISYAVAVHQIPGRRGYKFLEAAAKANTAGMEGRMGARLGQGLERAAA